MKTVLEKNAWIKDYLLNSEFLAQQDFKFQKDYNEKDRDVILNFSNVEFESVEEDKVN